MKISRMVSLAALTLLTACRVGSVAPALGGEGSVKVTRSEMSRQLPAYILGFNVNNARGPSWREPEALAAAVNLQPLNLRYPGGTVGNYWDWETGWFMEGTNPPHGLGNIEPTINKLEDFKVLIDATGAEPVYMLNMLTSDLEHQMNMLRHARAIGLKVRLVELGNEFYLPREGYMERFPAPEDYAREANEWIKTIKAEFPATRVGVVGAHERGTQGRRNNWNKPVLDAIEGADALTVHPYAGPNLAEEMDTLLEGTGLVPETRRDKRKSGMVAPEPYQQAQKEAMASAEGPGYALSAPFGAWDHFKATRTKLPEGMTFWFTEYGIFDRVGAIHSTWLHGLFVAAMSAAYIEGDNVELLCIHQLVGQPAFTAILTGQDPFARYMDYAETKRFSLSAMGVTIRHLCDALRGATRVNGLAFDPNPVMTSRTGTPWPTLVGWTIDSAEGRKAMIMNLGSQPADLAIAGSPLDGFETIDRIASDPGRRITGIEAVDRTGKPLENVLILPPFSITNLF